MKLETGYKNDFEIRRETITGAVQDDIRILYISDLHLNGYSGYIVNKLIFNVLKLNPHILLLGGDYVDSRSGLTQLALLLNQVLPGRRVFAVPGNHDKFLWAAKIKNTITSRGVEWLDNRSSTLIVQGTAIKIDGGKPSGNSDPADLSILLLHKPVDITPYQNEYDLAFAGHLHGCQFVFLETEKGLYPGRLFYKWNILKKRMGKCLYLISKGVGDTLPMRYNCKKDILLVTIKKDPGIINTSPSI